MKSNKKRQNILKSILFDRPDYIPMGFHINHACWTAYDQELLFDLMEEHPFLFPDFIRPDTPYIPPLSNVMQKDNPYTDDWGCLWETTIDGIVGTVTRHPLSDWEKLADYKIPDPEFCMGIGKVDWQAEKERIAHLKANGCLTMEGLRHGHTFLQLCDIRGYENTVIDMQDDEPRMRFLLDKITEFNLYIIKQYADMEVDVLTYAEDLGMQFGPMLSPAQFKEHIIPCYEKLLQPAKEKNIPVHMHSDGDIRTLTSYLLECGMNVLNLQDLVNGIDWIKDNLKDKVCIELDIDRQKVTPFGSPKDVDKLILDEVKTLSSPQGGLMMIYGLYPGVPPENIKALMDAMEKYAFYHS